MIVDIEFDTKDLKKSLKKLQEEIDRLPPEVYTSIADLALKSVQTNFELGGRPSTWERKKNGEPSFLQKTGALKESINTTVQGNTIEIGSPLDYAVFNQEGTGHIPSRPFILLQKEDEEEIENIVRKALMGARGK